MGPAKSDGDYDVKSKLYCRMSGFTFFPPLEVMVTVHVPSFESAVIDESSTEQVVLLTVGVSPGPETHLEWRSDALDQGWSRALGDSLVIHHDLDGVVATVLRQRVELRGEHPQVSRVA